MTEAERWLEIAEKCDVVTRDIFLCNEADKSTDRGKMRDRLQHFRPQLEDHDEWQVWWPSSDKKGDVLEANQERVIACCFLAAMADEAENART